MNLQRVSIIAFRVPLIVTLIILTFTSISVNAAGLNSYQSPDGKYAFLYPTGWVKTTVIGGPQVIFHDIINSDETISLLISDVTPESKLEALGDPTRVGEILQKKVIAPEGSGRKANLVEARQRDVNGYNFYDLEYEINLKDRKRHELATVIVNRGKLYTFAASTNEGRWRKVKSLFEDVVTSFTFLV
uniref:Photosystem II oxygen evolving complex protein PsbP n=1 Tax=Paulinella micropora TaxID=1928728 RepID=A0A1L5YCX9_9EUKA|nr:photosystem II oxygen evolving complex protein PsbP [Paulinella micropora]APP88548.1 photosystem II oxygen evolving complex protein PsbP [Paulinella micropora]AQX45315.1 Photosystem II oxygen evolving complex protein PsbP [Paulinella micropora]AXY63709.1 photosystem II oxygen evolving complex protein PsbP [Paulinella micropora]